MVGLDDLRKALLSERETGRLLAIPPDFFTRAHATLRSLRSEVAESEDPFSDDVQKMILESRSIEQTLVDLFAIRTSKILSLAETTSKGHYIDREEVKRMIPQEREMFDDVAHAISSCQEALVQDPAGTSLIRHEERIIRTDQSLQEERIAGTEHGTPPRADDQSPATAPAPAADLPSHPNPAMPYSYMVVRILSDMDAFMGVDGHTYDLQKGDIVTLPDRNAEVLVGRNIALNMNVGK